MTSNSKYLEQATGEGEGFTVKRWGMKSAAGEILLMEDVNHSSLTNNLKFS